ncbi:MAG: tRNA 4-thiouridine(8) synthase ThiI [Oscillospiraceae bacterium]|jgi:thiamine biosynthesis protein ThiI|nr:tRNA 4-thiouridine(8) synthase ThiI [Oscillospiraceae bacterium]
MNDMILLKQGELVLKGLNKRSFETRLIANIRKALAPFGEFDVYAMQSAVYVEPQSPDCDMDAALDACGAVFGVNTVTRAAACEKDMDAIFDTAARYLGDELRSAASFKVESKRADKRFPMTSIDISRHIGGRLAEAYPHVRVDVRDPALCVNIEIRDTAAYVHGKALRGAGGLPVGVSGRAVTLLSGGIDSPVAAYMAAKRGLRLIPVHFASPPYTSELARRKAVELAGILSRYCGRMAVETVPFTRIQETIGQSCPEGLHTVIARRFMMRAAERIALYHGCGAIVTGESLGQVASQTLQAMTVTQECISLPVLRPCVGLDKREIIDIANSIGTYETSILPYEDCCAVFTPRRPRTKPPLREVLEAESGLDVEGLVGEALEGIVHGMDRTGYK